MTTAQRPTERLTLPFSDETDVAAAQTANAAILDFATQLEAKGQRPWFEVWYSGTTAATFDAVEVIGGVIRTLPPYSEMTS